MKNLKYLLSYIFAFSICVLCAQQNNTTVKHAHTIDSLQNCLKAAIEDTSKVNILNNLSLECLNEGSYEQSMHYAQEGQSIAEQINYKKGIAGSYNNIGNVFRKQGNYEMSLNAQLNALKILEEIGNKKSIVDSYNSIAGIYFRQGNYEKSMEFYKKCLKYGEENADRNEIAAAYSNIGNIYFFQEHYEKGMDNYLKSLKIRIEIGDKKGIADSYNNIGDIYEDQKKFDKSIENRLKSLKINKEIGDKQGIANCFYKIGRVYEKQNIIEESYYYLNQSLMLFKELGDKHYVMKLYSAISELYNKKNDFKKALEYHKLFSDIKDTLLNEKSAKQITEMNAKYESEKKEKNIESLTKDKALQQAEVGRQKLIRNSFISGLILVLFFAFILLNRFTIKQKLNVELNSKNDELLQKNILIENQKEKIVDSIIYAKSIQHSILLEEREIQKYLPDSFIYYKPKDIVSGDFYWCSKINNKIIIAAVDCTGHGVPGAFMSLIGNTLLNNIVNEKQITKPSEILRHLNRGVFEALHQDKIGGLSDDGMDIALCCIDFSNNQVEFAGAQNPLYVLSGNKLEVFKGDIHTIGGRRYVSKHEDPAEIEYTNHVIPITNPMNIYLFSDGYMDQFGGLERKKYGMHRFKDLLLNNRGLHMQKQKKIIAAAHDDWKGNSLQIDDILVMGFRLENI